MYELFTALDFPSIHSIVTDSQESLSENIDDAIAWKSSLLIGEILKNGKQTTITGHKRKMRLFAGHLSIVCFCEIHVLEYL